jgi:hypothetical protein
MQLSLSNAVLILLLPFLADSAFALPSPRRFGQNHFKHVRDGSKVAQRKRAGGADYTGIPVATSTKALEDYLPAKETGSTPAVNTDSGFDTVPAAASGIPDEAVSSVVAAATSTFGSFSYTPYVPESTAAPSPSAAATSDNAHAGHLNVQAEADRLAQEYAQKMVGGFLPTLTLEVILEPTQVSLLFLTFCHGVRLSAKSPMLMRLCRKPTVPGITSFISVQMALLPPFPLLSLVQPTPRPRPRPLRRPTRATAMEATTPAVATTVTMGTTEVAAVVTTTALALDLDLDQVDQSSHLEARAPAVDHQDRNRVDQMAATLETAATTMAPMDPARLPRPARIAVMATEAIIPVRAITARAEITVDHQVNSQVPPFRVLNRPSLPPFQVKLPLATPVQ